MDGKGQQRFKMERRKEFSKACACQQLEGPKYLGGIDFFPFLITKTSLSTNSATSVLGTEVSKINDKSSLPEDFVFIKNCCFV